MTPRYDGIVLAAGRNTRLKGIIPSYHKPLVIVNGRPLVVNIVRELLGFCAHVVVVVSPENCAPITEVLRDNGMLEQTSLVTILIQPEARGPGEGLLRALRVCRSSRVVLGLADNIIPRQDWLSVLEQDQRACREDQQHSDALVTFAYNTTTDTEEALRFTRVYDHAGRLTFIEGQQGGRDERGVYRYWVGPMIFDRMESELALLKTLTLNATQTQLSPPVELKISGPLSSIPNLRLLPVAGSSVDIGTSDALVQLEN